VTLSIYNLTNQKNWQPSPVFYGNDFVVLQDPRTVEVRLEAKF
jgi:outer membrane receptor protein involved in Fe transport